MARRWVTALTGISVNRMGDLAGKAIQDDLNPTTILRLENLDTDIPPDPIVAEIISC